MKANKLPQLTFSSKRCHIRRIQAADQASVLRLFSEPKVRQYLEGALSLPEAQQRWQAMLRQSLEKEEVVAQPSFTWSVIENVSGQCIGLIFLDTHHNRQEIELSYMFLPETWGQGFAQETLQMICQFSQHQLGLPRLLAETQTQNLASCKRLQSLGFEQIDAFERFGELQSLYALAFEGT